MISNPPPVNPTNLQIASNLMKGTMTRNLANLNKQQHTNEMVELLPIRMKAD